MLGLHQVKLQGMPKCMGKAKWVAKYALKVHPILN